MPPAWDPPKLLLVVVSGLHIVVGTSRVVVVVIDSGIWLLGSIVWLLWQEGFVVDVVDHRGTDSGLGVPRRPWTSSARPGGAGGGDRRRRPWGIPTTWDEAIRWREAPRLGLVGGDEVDESREAPGRFSRGGELFGRGDDDDDAAAASGDVGERKTAREIGRAHV